MTKQQEAVTAERIGRIMRCARKELGLTQNTVAQKISVSQAQISKFESGILIPSALEWYEFTKLTRVPFDALHTGFIDRMEARQVESDPREGAFKIPARYAENRASRVRALQVFVRFFEHKLGAKKTARYFKDLGMDPDYFMNLDHQLNVQFFYDMCAQMIEKRWINERNLHELVARPFSQTSFHGSLASDYETQRSARGVIKFALKHSNLYEGNNTYAVEDEKPLVLDFSVTRREHIRGFDDSAIGDLSCRLKQEAFRGFAALPAGASGSAKLVEKQCMHKGADRCVYRMIFQ